MLAGDRARLVYHGQLRVPPQSTSARVICWSVRTARGGRDERNHMSYSMHTHTCGELRESNIGEEVTLTGWVWHRRDHGGLIFVDLRDRAGVTQLEFDPEVCDEATFHEAETIRSEWPIMVSGTVRERPEGQNNDKLATGAIEVYVTKIVVLNTSKTPPFQIEDHVDTAEDVRLRYRYLDLRRPKMTSNLKLRSDFTFALREAFHGSDFMEVETPSLFKSTPEAPATSWFPAACSRATSTPCRSPRSSSRSSSWWVAWSATTRWPSASATRTCARTASPSSPRWTSR